MSVSNNFRRRCKILPIYNKFDPYIEPALSEEMEMENQIVLRGLLTVQSKTRKKETWIPSFLGDQSALCKPPPRHEESRRTHVYSRRSTSGLRNRTFIPVVSWFSESNKGR